MATVYVLRHICRGYSFIGFRGGASYGNSSEIIGTFATEELVKKAMNARRLALLSGNGASHMRAEDHPDGRGFSYGSTMGSMSFIPGAFAYVEQEVVDE